MLKSSVIYLLVFSFLLAGCYTTEQYSDTPSNIISGTSKIKNDDDFVPEKIILKTDSIIYISGFITKFIECGRDTCSKFVYKSKDLKCDTIKAAEQNPMMIRCKEPVTDTLDVSKIKMIQYIKKEFDSGSTIFIAAIVLIVPVGYAIISAIGSKMPSKY
ncbi:MAG: hypothetical protein PHN88_01750 [Ignavibacteria bacterium]|nr:hypothetical protein [Ignavibacteria bacterium]